MLSKTSILLTIVGTVAADLYIPRRVSEYSSGWGYGITLYPNGTYNYNSYMSFDWDLDLNCAYLYAQSYDDYSWFEQSTC
jgi:hypothetical protein